MRESGSEYIGGMESILTRLHHAGVNPVYKAVGRGTQVQTDTNAKFKVTYPPTAAILSSEVSFV